MQDEDERDLHNQHEAMARRRSSNHAGAGPQQKHRKSSALACRLSPVGTDDANNSDDEAGASEDLNARRKTSLLKNGGESFDGTPEKKRRVTNVEERALRWKNIERRQQQLKVQQMQQIAEEKKKKARELGEAEAAALESKDAATKTNTKEQGTSGRRTRRTARMSKKF